MEPKNKNCKSLKKFKLLDTTISKCNQNSSFLILKLNDYFFIKKSLIKIRLEKNKALVSQYDVTEH